MNLEEVTGQEMTDENMKEILPKLLHEADNKKKIMMKKMENRKKLMQMMKKEAKKTKNGVMKKLTRKNNLSPITGFNLFPFHYERSS